MPPRFSVRAALLAPACALLLGMASGPALADSDDLRRHGAGHVLAQNFDRDDLREWRRDRRDGRRDFRRDRGELRDRRQDFFERREDFFDRRADWFDRRDDFFDRRRDFFDRRFDRRRGRDFRGFRDGRHGFRGDFDRHRHRFDRRFDRRDGFRGDHRFGRGFPPRHRRDFQGGPPWMR